MVKLVMGALPKAERVAAEIEQALDPALSEQLTVEVSSPKGRLTRVVIRRKVEALSGGVEGGQKSP